MTRLCGSAGAGSLRPGLRGGVAELGRAGPAGGGHPGGEDDGPVLRAAQRGGAGGCEEEAGRASNRRGGRLRKSIRELLLRQDCRMDTKWNINYY